MQVILKNRQVIDLLKKIDENYAKKAKPIEDKAMRRYLRLSRVHGLIKARICSKLMNTKNIFDDIDFRYRLRNDRRDWSPFGKMQELVAELRNSKNGTKIIIDSNDLELLEIFSEMDFCQQDYGCQESLAKQVKALKAMCEVISPKPSKIKIEEESKEIILLHPGETLTRTDLVVKAKDYRNIAMLAGAALGGLLGIGLVVFLAS